MTPPAKRAAAAILVSEHALSVVRACKIVRFSRAAYYRTPQPPLAADAEVGSIFPTWVVRVHDQPGVNPAPAVQAQ